MRQGLARIAHYIARFIALVCATLFVVTAVATLPLFNSGWHLFSPEIYKRALADQRLYTRLPALAAEQFDLQLHSTGPGPEGGEASESESTPEPGAGPPPALVNLTRADWEQLLSTLLPPEWLRGLTESALDQGFALMDSTDETPVVAVSLVELKEHLAGEAGVSAFLQLVRAQPPCDQAGLEQWTAGVTTELPTCRPPEEVLEGVTPQIGQMLSEYVAEIPNEADLAQAFGGANGPDETSPSDAGEEGPDPRLVLRRIRLALRLSPLIPIVLLLAVAVFAVRARKDWLRWWGLPLLLAGLVGLVLATAMVPVMTWGYVRYAADRVPPYLSESLVQAGLDVVWQISRTLAGWMGGEAALMGLIGLAMLVYSFFIPDRSNLPSRDERLPYMP